jgi:xylulokinase
VTAEGPFLIGIDLGTTVCKALVFDSLLRVRAGASRRLGLAALSGSRIEQDAEEWWSAAAEVTREAVAGAGIDPAAVAGLAVSSQGITVVPVDGGGAPLRGALTWMDTRALDQARRVARRFGEKRIFALTGKRCSEQYTLPKLLWLQEHEPRILDECARLLMPLDFLTERLTGECLTDPSMASGTMLFDVGRRAWSARILDAFGLDERKLPGVVPGAAAVGALRPAAAEALGLPPGVTVAMGGQDQKVAAIGAGIDLEACTLSLGTAMALTRKTDRPVLDRLMRVPGFADPLPGRWVLEGSAVCCAILDWARSTLLGGAGWGELDRLAAEAEGKPGPALLLPFFCGSPAPYPDPRARGALCGLDLATSPGQIVRAVFDGIAFLVRDNLAVMEELGGPVPELRLFGGGSRSAVWRQILADAARRPVRAVGTPEAGALGAAMLAGTAAGVFADVAAAQALSSPAAEHAPRGEAADRYDERYGEWSALRACLTGRNA